MTAALYETRVSHLRQSPLRHAFSYRSYWWQVDLDDLPPQGPLARFRAADHLGGSGSIRADVDALLAQRGLMCRQVLMLANARVLGHVFNPLSLFHCLADDGSVVAVVAEVHNTYGGRHAYVLQPDPDGRADVDKQLYVSPFHPVEGSYHLRVPLPGEQLQVDLRYSRPGARPFVATVRGRRLPATRANVLRVAVRYPLAPLAVALRIRLQGVRLWLRRLPVHPRTPKETPA